MYNTARDTAVQTRVKQTLEASCSLSRCMKKAVQQTWSVTPAPPPLQLTCCITAVGSQSAQNLCRLKTILCLWLSCFVVVGGAVVIKQLRDASCSLSELKAFPHIEQRSSQKSEMSDVILLNKLGTAALCLGYGRATGAQTSPCYCFLCKLLFAKNLKLCFISLNPGPKVSSSRMNLQGCD